MVGAMALFAHDDFEGQLDSSHVDYQKDSVTVTFVLGALTCCSNMYVCMSDSEHICVKCVFRVAWTRSLVLVSLIRR